MPYYPPNLIKVLFPKWYSYGVGKKFKYLAKTPPFLRINFMSSRRWWTDVCEYLIIVDLWYTLNFLICWILKTVSTISNYALSRARLIFILLTRSAHSATGLLLICQQKSSLFIAALLGRTVFAFRCRSAAFGPVVEKTIIFQCK